LRHPRRGYVKIRLSLAGTLRDVAELAPTPDAVKVSAGSAATRDAGFSARSLGGAEVDRLTRSRWRSRQAADYERARCLVRWSDFEVRSQFSASRLVEAIRMMKVPAGMIPLGWYVRCRIISRMALHSRLMSFRCNPSRRIV